MQTISKINCRACNRTHFGLWSNNGDVVTCPIEKVEVWTATGKVVDLLPDEPAPQPVPEPPQEPEEEQPEPAEKPAAKKTARRTRKTAKK